MMKPFDEADELQEFHLEDSVPGLPTLKLPPLRGTEKQIKWATTIRADALNLRGWTPETAIKLCNTVDSTWWIANRQIVATMNFKEPAPNQMASSKPEPDDEADYEPKPYPEDRSIEKRLGDAGAFAASVSGSPRLAEAAVLAVLSRAYRDDMRDSLRKRAKHLVDQFELDTARDIAAIRKMIE